MQRIEIVGDRRRAHDAGFRAEMVTQSLAAGVGVKDLARRNGICASLIYRWRREQPDVEAGAGAHLLPVRIASENPPPCVAPAPPRPSPPVSRPAGSIEIELAGGVRVHVGGDVSLPALRRVIAALRG
ncbi:IS66-like element accessory protein TnpA [Limobrevibacterium gyesilva]|uniref:Transposase n=1 Tax=Limobrevibacterium gyesilva TaxID=2991712 RepID=A0AA41YR28_9PROT|nr:transposase [Limobrevibacterium gyesilva]MCW3474940.1 transposase [Limobrevibacterium gyesilva]